MSVFYIICRGTGFKVKKLNWRKKESIFHLVSFPFCQPAADLGAPLACWIPFLSSSSHDCTDWPGLQLCSEVFVPGMGRGWTFASSNIVMSKHPRSGNAVIHKPLLFRFSGNFVNSSLSAAAVALSLGDPCFPSWTVQAAPMKTRNDQRKYS